MSSTPLFIFIQHSKFIFIFPLYAFSLVHSFKLRLVSAHYTDIVLCLLVSQNITVHNFLHTKLMSHFLYKFYSFNTK